MPSGRGLGWQQRILPLVVALLPASKRRRRGGLSGPVEGETGVRTKGALPDIELWVQGSAGPRPIRSEESVTAGAKKTIDGLPQTLDAVAVVVFANSMPAEQLVAFNRRHKICGGADVSYIYSPSFYDDSSGEPPLNAVVWNRDMAKEDSWPELAYQCETEPEVALAEFRTWVGRQTSFEPRARGCRRIAFGCCSCLGRHSCLRSSL